jgi:hypothetical protein
MHCTVPVPTGKAVTLAPAQLQGDPGTTTDGLVSMLERLLRSENTFAYLNLRIQTKSPFHYRIIYMPPVG